MATKKTTKKKPVTKKSTVKKNSKLAPTFVGLRPETEDFMTFRVTKQTVYWLVLGAVVILFSIWIMRLQADIQSIYDQIEIDAAEVNAVDLPLPTKK